MERFKKEQELMLEGVGLVTVEKVYKNGRYLVIDENGEEHKCNHDELDAPDEDEDSEEIDNEERQNQIFSEFMNTEIVKDFKDKIFDIVKSLDDETVFTKKSKPGELIEEITSYVWEDVFEAMSTVKIGTISARKCFYDWLSFEDDSEGYSEFFKEYDDILKKKDKAEKNKSYRGGNKYWEEEDAVEIETEGNTIKVYKEAGKIQVYKRISSANYEGLSKAVTIDAAECSKDESVDIMLAMAEGFKNQVCDDRFDEILDLLNAMKGDE